MPDAELVLCPKAPFDFELTASTFARFRSENVDLYAGGVYRRALDLGDKLVLATVGGQGSPQQPRLCLTVQGEALRPVDLERAGAMVARIFRLEDDLGPFYRRAERDRVLRILVHLLWGLKQPRRPSLFETLVLSITAQQLTLAFTSALKSRLVAAWGRKLSLGEKAYYAFPRPEALARASISQLRQLKYSQKNENSIDMVLFLNGIPIITAELKNSLTGQMVEHAIKQYKTDRDPKEPLLKFKRCLVHFAGGNEKVFMTTHLQKGNTYFLPFNKVT